MIQGRIGGLNKLIYRPPAQTTPTTVEVPAGSTFFSHTFAAGEDGVIVLPAGKRTRGISFTGGRHIRIVGGEIDLTAGNQSEPPIRASKVSGSITPEGVLINGGGANKDLLDLGGSTAEPWTYAPDIYLLNLRLLNITGTFETEHADLFQPQAAIGTLYVDKVTGLELGYQGFFVRPQKPIAAMHFNRVNLGYRDEGITYLLWLASGSETPVPTTLNEVYVQPRAGQTLIDHAIWPKAGQVNGAGEAIGAFSEDGGLAAQYPARTLTSGRVSLGAPGGGDFVKSTDCGLGYVSPGYL